jgi:hypothetical protein
MWGLCHCREREIRRTTTTRRRNKERSGEVLRNTTLGGVRKKESIFPVLKIPRQCPLVLLVNGSAYVRN